MGIGRYPPARQVRPGRAVACPKRKKFRLIEHLTFTKKEQTCPEDCVNHSLHFEAKTFLHGLPVEEDKLSMVYSLEARVPFLDNDLVYFSMHISARDRKQGKKGFSAPDSRWFKGENIDYVRREILNSGARALMNFWMHL